MRVCVIGPAPPLRGGVAKHTAGLAEVLVERCHDVRVISYRRLYPNALFPGRTQTDGTTSVGEALLDTLDPRTWARVRASVRDWKPDLVIAQLWHPCTAGALAVVLGGTPARVAVVCHNVRPHEWFPLWRSAARAILRRADLALCHSQFVAREVACLAPRVASQVAEMPVLLSAEGPVTPSRHAGPTALFAGLIRSYKGVELMLDAWRRARLPPNARLVIAGESYLRARSRDALARRSRTHGGVCLMERWLEDSELWSLMLGADVLVLPYLRASQSGLVPLALRAGLAVIATDVGGLAEGLDSRSGCHVIVKAGDCAGLARAFERTMMGAGPSPNALRQQLVCPEARDAASWLATAQAVEHVAMQKRA